MNGPTLLITGIHGLVGQYLFKILDLWKGKVVITGKGSCRLPGADFIYIDMDIADKDRVCEIFEIYAPSVVIHSAALAQPDYCELNREEAVKVNVGGTENLLEASSQSGAFFVHLSTDFVFSGADGPYDENADPAPVNFYGTTKLMGEEKVKAYPFSWAIIRTALVYGNVIVGTRPNMISWVKSELEQGKPIKVVSDQVRTTTYAGDLAWAILKIAERKAEGMWHISGPHPLTPWEMAMAVSDFLNLDSQLITKVDASVFSQPAERPLKTPLIIDKAIKELGYRPISFDKGMKLVLQGD
ncbi:MAG TPA: SDR family oxidoreductase [Chitinophagaceae bacterium]|nr:SDR family oxidoreductase [Chitinophagaceae bacterium]